jgi:hypothetical protein
MASKMQTKRVRRHLIEVRERLRAVHARVGWWRPAVDADDELPNDWRTLDLLTVALDLSDDVVLRRLVNQARTGVLSVLSPPIS